MGLMYRVLFECIQIIFVLTLYIYPEVIGRGIGQEVCRRAALFNEIVEAVAPQWDEAGHGIGGVIPLEEMLLLHGFYPSPESIVSVVFSEREQGSQGAYVHRSTWQVMGSAIRPFHFITHFIFIEIEDRTERRLFSTTEQAFHFK